MCLDGAAGCLRHEGLGWPRVRGVRGRPPATWCFRCTKGNGSCGRGNLKGIGGASPICGAAGGTSLPRGPKGNRAPLVLLGVRQRVEGLKDGEQKHSSTYS